MKPSLLCLLTLATLSAPAWAQSQSQSQFSHGNTNITYAGPPGSPGNLSALQGVLPGAQISPISAAPPHDPSQAPSQESLIGRGVPTPVGPQPAFPGEMGAPPTSQELEEEKIFPETEADRAERRAALWDAGSLSQSLRQKGIALGQGDQYFGSIANRASPQDGQVLKRWKAWLPQFGVDPAKVEYESRRLSRPSFDAWASRFVWLACSPQSGAARPLGCDALAR